MTVTPEGFRFRQQLFQSLEAVLSWFKVHYREPPPGSKFCFSVKYLQDFNFEEFCLLHFK